MMERRRKGVDASPDLDAHKGGVADATGHVSSGLQPEPMRGARDDLIPVEEPIDAQRAGQARRTAKEAGLDLDDEDAV